MSIARTSSPADVFNPLKIMPQLANLPAELAVEIVTLAWPCAFQTFLVSWYVANCLSMDKDWFGTSEHTITLGPRSSCTDGLHDGLQGLVGIDKELAIWVQTAWTRHKDQNVTVVSDGISILATLNGIHTQNGRLWYKRLDLRSSEQLLIRKEGIVRDIDTGPTTSPFWNIRDPPSCVEKTHFPLLSGEEGKDPPTFMTACAVGDRATRVNAYYNQGVVRLTSSTHICSNVVPAEQDDDPGVHLQFHVSEGERLTRVWLCYRLTSAPKCPALIIETSRGRRFNIGPVELAADDHGHEYFCLEGSGQLVHYLLLNHRGAASARRFSFSASPVADVKTVKPMAPPLLPYHQIPEKFVRGQWFYSEANLRDIARIELCVRFSSHPRTPKLRRIIGMRLVSHGDAMETVLGQWNEVHCSAPSTTLSAPIRELFLYIEQHDYRDAVIKVQSLPPSIDDDVESLSGRWVKVSSGETLVWWFTEDESIVSVSDTE